MLFAAAPLPPLCYGLLQLHSSGDDASLVRLRKPTRCEAAMVPLVRRESLWTRLKERARLLRRLTTLGLLSTPLAFAGSVLYLLKLVGLESTVLEEWWWAVALRAVERAGPTFIKLCQWASTRNDVFPEAMTRRFSKLHENVAPHSSEHTAKLLEGAFGNNWNDRIQTAEVLGSGCIAQVYKGSAVDEYGVNRQVAVKVVHPGVRELVALDMTLLRLLGDAVERLFPSSRYLGIVETLSNFEFLMQRQLDLRHEAYNLKKLAALFHDDDTVIVPKPVDLLASSHVAAVSGELGKRKAKNSRVSIVDQPASSYEEAWLSPDVLVEDYVEGKPIQSFVGSPDATTKLLARRGAMVLLRMVLQFNFVHGDLHPGNLLVDESMRICLLDAGICIELPPRAHDNMVAMLRAMLECRGQDAGRLMLDTEAAHTSRLERDTTNENNFVEGVARMVERARDQSFYESIAEYYGDICALAVQNRVTLDGSFISVALAVKIVEGLVTSLQPNFPILELALPMFLKAQFKHASAEKLGRLSAFSRKILNGN